MRVIEITGKYKIPLTNEESDLYEKIQTRPHTKKELTERELVIANNLVIKEVVIRKLTDGAIIYYKNERSNLI